jgi:hypothetical protein
MSLGLLVISACATRGTHSTAAPPQAAAPPEIVPASQAAPAPNIAPVPEAPQEPPATVPGATTAAPAPAPTEPAAIARPPHGEPPPAAQNQLPPCVPARKPHHPRKVHPKEPQGPEPPTPAKPPAEIDAQVGEIGTSLTSILGKNVESPKGEGLGRVVDVLADAEGHVRVAIIDFGGFLGVGTRRIAVDWPLLRFNPKDHSKSLTLSVTREKLQSAPEYKEAASPRVLMPPESQASQDAANTGETKK